MLLKTDNKSTRNCLHPEVNLVVKIHRGFFLSPTLCSLKYTQPSPSKYPRTKSPTRETGTAGNVTDLLLLGVNPNTDRSACIFLLPICNRYPNLCVDFFFGRKDILWFEPSTSRIRDNTIRSVI